LGVYIQAFQVIALEIPLLKRAATGTFTPPPIGILTLLSLQELAKGCDFMSFHFARAAIFTPNRPSFCQVKIFVIHPLQFSTDYLFSEKKMLWNNRSIWAGHSQWIIALLKAVDWNDPEAARQGRTPFYFSLYSL
jgi:hypothetical protein